MFSINKILDCCYTAVSDFNYPFIKAAENFPKKLQTVLLLKKAAIIDCQAPNKVDRKKTVNCKGMNFYIQ